MKVIERPPTHDAIQFVISNWPDVLKFLERHGFEGTYQQSKTNAWVQFIGTDGRPQRAWCDDYLIEDGGEIRVCRRDYFNSRFEIVEK